MAVSSVPERDSSEPLASLRALIDRARDIEPASGPAVRGEDPVATIRDWISSEANELGSAGGGEVLREQAVSRSGDAVNSSASGGLEARLGTAVLEMVAEEPLSAQARAEAVRLLAAAMDDPTQASLRRVLRVLIRG